MKSDIFLGNGVHVLLKEGKALCLVGGDPSIFLGEFLFVDLMLLGILEIRTQILHVWKLKVGEILQFTEIFGHSDERLCVFDHV